MKKVVIKSMLLTLLVVLSTSIFLSVQAQSKAVAPKVYAVINRADWCPVCQANGARVMSEVIPAFKNNRVKFIANDLTNQQTIGTSIATLKKNHVYDAVKEAKSTGVILLVNAKTKKVVKQISVAETSAEIIKEITAVRG
jgi:hypothetical protein